MSERSTGTQTALEPTQVKIVRADTLLERFNALAEQISRRAYEIFEGKGRTFGDDVEDWLKAESEILHPVHIRVVDQDEALTVEAEVPGFNAKELEVSFEAGCLTISGKRETKKEQKKGRMIYQEQCSEQLLRVIDLPSEVDSTKVATTLKNGILEITIPKIGEALAKTPPIGVKAT
ncbi:MAG: Hsp20 family protein [Candidatus Acidiferrales bacterium]|jgi:HSP20 family protein